MRMRNDAMLRNRNHVIAQFVGLLDHRRLLRSCHAEFPARCDRRQLKRVRQRERQLHTAMMSGQLMTPPGGGLTSIERTVDNCTRSPTFATEITMRMIAARRYDRGPRS